MKLGSPLPCGIGTIQDNYETASRLRDELYAHVHTLELPEGDLTRKRHEDRGKLYVRDRVKHLLDPGSPFLEIGALTGLGVYEGVPPGAGIVTGIGLIHGQPVMVIANDATVKGGAYFPLTVKKHLRAQEIAFENRLPCYALVDSGGAFLPLQDQVFPDREHFGRIFYNQARMSALGIPQIAVVMGSCTAGGAYVPAMSDQVVMVAEQGTIFLGGPPLVKAATGEVVSSEDLGGAEVHTSISGVADYLAQDDYEALQIARGLLPLSSAPALERRFLPPLYPESDLLSLLPSDPRKPFPMREVLARLLDGSELSEFKARFGKTLICGFASLYGLPVGVIANDGILFSESALKGCHFIQLCNQRGIPLLFVQNVTGFMVGKQYEHAGIAKDGAKFVNAVSCSNVPKITLIVGGSFGAGNYAMAGRAYSPRFLFTWPNSQTAVMGPEQAATVLTQIRSDSMRSKKKSWSEVAKNRYFKQILKTYESQSSAFYATARLWDDGVIDPLHTREILGRALQIVSDSMDEDHSIPRYGVFRM